MMWLWRWWCRCRWLWRWRGRWWWNWVETEKKWIWDIWQKYFDLLDNFFLNIIMPISHYALLSMWWTSWNIKHSLSWLIRIICLLEQKLSTIDKKSKKLHFPYFASFYFTCSNFLTPFTPSLSYIIGDPLVHHVLTWPGLTSRFSNTCVTSCLLRLWWTRVTTFIGNLVWSLVSNPPPMAHWSTSKSLESW